MKVKLKKKKQLLSHDELRVINIDLKAVEELLFENLMEHQAEYFNTDEMNENEICCMQFDKESGILTYIVMPIEYAFEGKQLDYDFFRKKIGLTTHSLFQPNRYRRLRIVPQCFISSKTDKHNN